MSKKKLKAYASVKHSLDNETRGKFYGEISKLPKFFLGHTLTTGSFAELPLHLSIIY